MIETLNDIEFDDSISKTHPLSLDLDEDTEDKNGVDYVEEPKEEVKCDLELDEDSEVSFDDDIVELLSYSKYNIPFAIERLINKRKTFDEDIDAQIKRLTDLLRKYVKEDIKMPVVMF